MPVLRMAGPLGTRHEEGEKFEGENFEKIKKEKKLSPFGAV